MLNETKRKRVFSRRALILGSFQAGLIATLIGRLYYLQVLKSDTFQTLSDSNRIKLFLLPPQRGRILDRNGEVMAESRHYYRALLDPEQATNVKETILRFSEILKLDDKTLERLLKRAASQKARRPWTLYDHLSWDQLARIEVHSPDLPGVSIEVGQARSYPEFFIAPHVLGYVGPVTESDIEKNPLLNHPDFKVGKHGVEQTQEAFLRGEAGVRRMEVNAFGLTVRELSRVESVAGQDVKLTINRGVQAVIADKLKNVTGSAVVIDVVTGEVIAMVSAPNFDPNQFSLGVSSDYWRKLITDEDKPLINKSVSNQYPPGSTFKAATALAALGTGIDPETSVFCPGYVALGNHRFHCWKEHGHGSLNMIQAIQQSCNVYFYTMSKRCGEAAIAKAARALGMGSLTGIELPDEKPGLVPDAQWKLKRVKEAWQAGDTLNMGIGQGFLLTTPLQLALAAARLASGKKVLPHISADKKGAANFANLPIPLKHLQLVREGMRRVVNVQGGTAYASRLSTGFEFSGKTGTAQVISKRHLEAIKHLSDDEKKKRQHHGLFFGFGPVASPRYAVGVVVENGGSGSGAAAPVAKRAFQALQEVAEGRDPLLLLQEPTEEKKV